jgi:transcriptional regulator GlxA family with amidase domain
VGILIVGKSKLSFNHPYHDHDTWEIIVNTDGVGYFQSGEVRRAFRPGSIVCVPPRVPHEKISEEGYMDVWVQLSEFPKLDQTKPTFLSDDAEGSIASLIHVLHTVQYGKLPNRSVMRECLVESIQQLILGRVSRTKVDAEVEAIMTRIVHNFHDPDFSIDEALTEHGYCADHMRRLFREQVGKTPQEYLSALRIRSAKKLLASRAVSNYSVSEISNMTGFSNVSYFSRAFKLATGMPPSLYFGEKE